MSVLGRVLLSSAQRLDLADLKSVDSFVGGDFKYLIKSLIGDAKPYILKGFEVINPGDMIGKDSGLAIKVSDSVVYYPTSNAGSFFYGLSEGNILSQPLVATLKTSATNYIYLTLDTQDTSPDSRAFWDPDKNGGDGGEYSQVVNTESVLVATVNTSVSTFPANTIPVCKVTLDATGITKIEDCRDLMFRLGEGGINPTPYSIFNFRNLPSSTYSRLEPSTTMTAGSDPNPFQGGDKNIQTLKEWMDAVMTKLLELGGTPYWYSYASSISVASVFQDTLGSMFKSKGKWEHDAVVPGKVYWTADITYKSMIDPRDIIIRAGNVTIPNERVAFLSLIRGSYINSGPTGVDWVNGVDYVNAANSFSIPLIGCFENLKKGDWIKKKDDPDHLYFRVEEFYASINKGGGTTTPALAKSVGLHVVYTGVAQADVQSVFTRGEYLSSDVSIVDRNDPSLSTAGGNMMWLAARSDTIVNISNAEAFQITGDIIDNDTVKARFNSVAHGLLDGDRITIVGSVNHNGTYQIEVEDADNFIIQVTSPATETGVNAFYALVDTTSRSTTNGFVLETGEHGLENNETIWVAGTTNYNGNYAVNVRSVTRIQVPFGSSVAVEATGTVSAVKLEVRKSFGAIRIIQGESIDIGEADGENIQKFIGMNSLSEVHPTYALPLGFNTLSGQQNFNSDPTDSLATRVAKLTAMMADRVQDRGMRILGKVILRNTTAGANQVISASTSIVIERPNSGADVITLACTLPTNSAAVAVIDRDAPGAVSVTVESLGSSFLLAENKIVLLYRLADQKVYTWDNQSIEAGTSYTSNVYETTQNKNLAVFYPGALDLDLDTDILTFSDSVQDMVVSIPGSVNQNTVDTSAINGLGGITLLDGSAAWVRIDRESAKVFNTIQTSIVEDTVIAGALYVTSISAVPSEQDAVVLFSRIGNALIGHHKPEVLKENVYEEVIDIIAGAPVNDHEITGPIPSGTFITLPSDLRDSGNPQYYVVGAGHLELYLNGQRLREGIDWNPDGTPGSVEQQIELLQTLVVGDNLLFRDSGNGGVYFANSAPLSFTMQDTYDAGRFITTVIGQPMVINGPVGDKLLQINGDIGITGLVDPTGITFIPQASDPIDAVDKGLWVDTAHDLKYKKSATVTIDVVNDFVRVDGTHVMTADLDLNNNVIKNLADPVDPQDAATKAHVTSEIGGLSGAYLALDGTNAMAADINANTHKVVNVVDPIDLQDAATKNYVDSLAGDLPNSYLKLDGTNAMSANLNVNNNNITNVASPLLASDAVNRGYVDSLDNKAGIFVPVTNNSGSAMLAGTVVRMSIAAANEVVLASSNSLSLAEGTVGIVHSDINDGASGHIQVGGKAFVRGSTFDLGKRVYVGSTAGLATPVAPTVSGTVVFFLGIACDVDQVVLSPNLDAINDNVYDEDWQASIAYIAGSVFTLPTDSRNGDAAQTYTVGEGLLEIYLNGQYLNLGDDWSEIGSPGTASSTILMNQSVASGDKITYRINVQNSAYFMAASGVGGSLQTAYNNGNQITVVSGSPITISGPANEKLFVVNGDIEVTGLVDPKGMTLIPQVSNPIPLDKAGIWASATGELMVQKGDNTVPLNMTTAVENVGTATTDVITITLTNKSGNLIDKATPVSVDSNGDITPVFVNVEDSAMSSIGLAYEAIADDDEGQVITHGVLKGIITTASMGQVLYVAKDGSLTSIKPTAGIAGFASGDFVVRLGVLVKDSVNPSQKNLVVNIQVVGQLG